MGMRDRIKKTADRVNRELADQELELLTSSILDVERLTPDIKSHEDYEPLMTLINNATANNESTAKLQSQIKELGKGAKDLTFKILDVLS